MGLGRQLLECLLRMFQRLALSPEGGIAQAWSTVFRCRTAVRKSAAVTRSIAARARIAALSGASWTSRRSRRVPLHTGAIIAAHCNYGTGNHLGRRCSCWCCSLVLSRRRLYLSALRSCEARGLLQMLLANLVCLVK